MRVGILEACADDGLLFMRQLQGRGHQVGLFLAMEDFLLQIQQVPFDLVILDWNHPDHGGDPGPALDALKQVRSLLPSNVSIVYVSSEGVDLRILEALTFGAEEFCVKPFHPGEFLARVAVWERRHPSVRTPRGTQAYYGYTFDPATRQVSWQGGQVVLPPKHFDIARYFFANCGSRISRKELSMKFWGLEGPSNKRTIDVSVSRIRRDLDLGGHSGLRLSGVYGQGYELICSVPEMLQDLSASPVSDSTSLLDLPVEGKKPTTKTRRVRHNPTKPHKNMAASPA